MQVDSVLNITKECAKKVFFHVEDSRTMGPQDHQRGEVFDLWRKTAERRVRRAENKRDLLMAFDKEKGLPFRLADVIEGLGSAASACKSKRAREEEDDEDGVVEVDSEGKSVSNKKARRYHRFAR